MIRKEKYVVSEIEYEVGPDTIHSDLDFILPINDNFRAFLHTALDEWLNESNGTGCFYLSAPGYKIDNQR